MSEPCPLLSATVLRAVCMSGGAVNPGAPAQFYDRIAHRMTMITSTNELTPDTERAANEVIVMLASWIVKERRLTAIREADAFVKSLRP